MMTAAARVAFLMAAVKAFAVMVSALMTASVVMSAFVPFTVMMAMVVALGVGVILQRSLRQRPGRCIRRAGHAAVEFDPRLGQCVLCAHTDAAADQCIRLRRFQEACQRAVTAAVGGNDLLRDDYAVLHVVELELLSVTEMLEDLSVFVSDCDSHISCSFDELFIDTPLL